MHDMLLFQEHLGLRLWENHVAFYTNIWSYFSLHKTYILARLRNPFKTLVMCFIRARYGRPFWFLRGGGDGGGGGGMLWDMERSRVHHKMISDCYLVWNINKHINMYMNKLWSDQSRQGRPHDNSRFCVEKTFIVRFHTSFIMQML